MDTQLFEKVVHFVRRMPEFDQLTFIPPMSNGEKLKLYALFKQATVGPCTGPRPSFFDVQGKYKYDAWRDLGDMSRAVAMASYVEHVVEYMMSVQASYADSAGLNLTLTER